jgi:hypothetical protein
LQGKKVFNAAHIFAKRLPTDFILALDIFASPAMTKYKTADAVSKTTNADLYRLHTIIEGASY